MSIAWIVDSLFSVSHKGGPDKKFGGLTRNKQDRPKLMNQWKMINFYQQFE